MHCSTQMKETVGLREATNPMGFGCENVVLYFLVFSKANCGK